VVWMLAATKLFEHGFQEKDFNEEKRKVKS